MLNIKKSIKSRTRLHPLPVIRLPANPFEPVSGDPFNYPIALVAPDDDCRPQIPATLDLNSSTVYRHLRKV